MIEAPRLTGFFGFVENNKDTYKANRYQVRVVGYNSPNPGVLPTENLKWFHSLNGVDPSLSGVGRSSRYLVGTMVFGLYIDNNLQEGIILGSIYGGDDVSSIARGEGGAIVVAMNSSRVENVPDGRGGTFSQPESTGVTTYPNSDTTVTQSGHMFQLDDTSGNEKIVIFHKSGTYQEILPDGQHTIRNVNDGYEINLKDKCIYVNGDFSQFINGDFRLNVGGEMYVKVGGGITFDTATVRTLGISEATDHLSSGVSGAFHLHGGVESGDGTTSTPLGYTTGFMPTPANVFSLTTEDTGFTPQVAAEGLKNGFITPEDVQIQETYVPKVEAVDETPAPEPKAEVVDCGAAIDANGKVDYSVLLAPGITLRSVSLGAVVSQYAIKDQVGLTRSDIICNLKNIAENVLVPLFKQYPTAMVTSGFRAGSGTSQHLKGEAVDIQFRGFNNEDYYNVCLWIKANLPYDQLIFEGKSFGTKLPWVHISLKRSKAQRYQILSFFNHKKIADGLRRLN